MIRYNKQGFSLVEILITIAIIGVLTAIGNVTYSSYIKKARQQEVKHNLSFAAARQKKHRAACGSFFPDLEIIDAVPEGVIHYNIGSHPQGFDADDDECLGGLDEDNSIDCSDSSTTCKSDLTSICEDQASDLKTNRDASCAFKDTRVLAGTKKYISESLGTLVQKLNRVEEVGDLYLKPKQLSMFAVSNLDGDCDDSTPSKCDAWWVDGRMVITHIPPSD